MLQKIYPTYGHVLFILIWYIFFPFLMHAEQPVCTDVHVSFSLDKERKYIDESIVDIFPDKIHVDHVMFESDLSISINELRYITDLYDGQGIDSDTIMHALYFLSKKNSFESVDISLRQTAEGVILHFFLHSAWIVAKIKIHGVLRGSQEYNRLYELEIGDQFDPTKHTRACQKLILHIIRNGYHDARIDDTYTYNKKTKTVDIHLSLILGKRYRISDVQLLLEVGSEKDAYILFLEQELQKRFARQLTDAWDVYDDISHVTAGCKKFILQEGFLTSEIILRKTFDAQNKKVSLFFTVDISNQKQFFFEGNSFFTQADLINQIAQFGKSVWLLPVELLSEEIERMYHDKGFWDVSIVPTQNDTSILFTITEGKRARIDYVRLTNSALVGEQKILRKLFREVVHGYVDNQKIQTALYEFVAQFIDLGYISSKVISHTYERISENRYTLIVAFDKGTRAYIDSVAVLGLQQEEYESIFFQKNDEKLPLSSDIILHQQRQLIEHCKDLGYVYAEVSPHVLNDNNKTTLEWNVETGPKVFFGKTIITGRPEFSFEKIMKRLNFTDGQLWDYALVHASLQQLKKITVFDVVQLYPDQTYIGKDQLLLLRLQHDDPFELRLRGGLELEHIQDYQTFGGVSYKVGSTLMVKNPFKIGDVFRFDADISGRHREITADYIVPVDMGGISTLKMQAYHILFEHPGFIGSKKNIYTIYQNGFLSGLQKRVGYVDFGCNIGLEWQKTEINDKLRADLLADAIGFDKNTLNKEVPYIFFEPTMYIDLLDNNLSPHKGLYTLFSLKGMVPCKENGATELFLKFHAEQAFFIPLYAVVFGVRFRFGHIFYQNFLGINPIERFYLGGSHSIRGYESDLVPPLKEFLDEDGEICVVPRGGKSMLNANLEMRFDLFENIGAVLFHDIGVLSAANFTEQDSFIAHTSGFGLRFHTPLGPLRFDIGFKWNRLFEQERHYAWYVTFGQAF